MTSTRRGFLTGGLAVGTAAGCRTGRSKLALNQGGELNDWAAVRSEFALSRDHIHLALMLLASHPRPVREAIERHRRALDDNPAGYFEERFGKAEAEARAAAAQYMGGSPDDIALTDSTTMSLAALYGGLLLKPGQQVLTTTHDHYSTHENLRLTSLRAGGGAAVKKVPLYDKPAAASEEEIVRRLVAAVEPRTRVVAVTWVHSSTGVKLPVRRLAAAVSDLNRKRDAASRILLAVDGVHAFGVERESPQELGCDFFAAGCHKWMFGPRGTGVLWGRPDAWKGHVGLIAPFELQPYMDWTKGRVPSGPPALLASPGGFHSFEHRWALGEAFAFHRRIGRDRITERIHALATQYKEGLAAMPHVTLHTPLSPALSAGIICFEVQGVAPAEVVKRLHARRIVASVTPYATEYVRFSPGILNTPEEVDTVLREIRAMKA